MRDEQIPHNHEDQPMEQPEEERRLSLAEIRELYFQGKMDRDEYFALERQIVPSFGYLAMEPGERARARLEAEEFKRNQRAKESDE